MKIIWLGNIIIPEICEKENLSKMFGGGWLVGMINKLSAVPGLDIVYIFDSNKAIRGETERYKYYGIECISSRFAGYESAYCKKLESIILTENPDVIHVWGTEYAHSYAMIDICRQLNLLDKVVVSLQGVVSKIAQHYCASLPNTVIYRYTLKDIFKGNVHKRKKVYEIKGQKENEIFQHVKHVIGRTDWDHACALNANSQLNYYTNNENLRDEFYEGDIWNIQECEKYRVFFSQGGYPVKGLHIMLKTLGQIAREFPETTLYVAGKDYLNEPMWKLGSYEKYVVSLIKKYDLKRNVFFTGYLDANQMKEQYLKANVFVSASSIENSPNSVGEAMILGVPIVASNVGGVNTIIQDKVEGMLFPFEEPYMLEYYVKMIFKDVKLANSLGRAARLKALFVHDREINANKLEQIYKAMM